MQHRWQKVVRTEAVSQIAALSSMIVISLLSHSSYAAKQYPHSLATESMIDTANIKQQLNSTSEMFGAQLFRGTFSTTSGSTFSDSYVIHVGDNIQVKMWGAYEYTATLTVDPQGNITLPHTKPFKVAGIKNVDLQSVVKDIINQTYRSYVGVYASLEEAQPVKVFVTGFVNQPGYYGGLSADSILSYLDRAGGVDPKRGSYIAIEVRRDDKLEQQVNLYNFLLAGRMQTFHFKDGDVITVAPQKKTFSVKGNVQNAYTFEFSVPDLTIGDVLAVANPEADATYISITRGSRLPKEAEVYNLDDAQDVAVYDGDSLIVTTAVE